MAVEATEAEMPVARPQAGGERAERDEVYWTELEVRRLGNVVAEMVQARRYCGDTSAAEAERALMHARLDAMRRKALRVLHRAELHVNAGQTTWPGLDASLTQPVNLAEEYVRTVAYYLDVLEEEEERVKRAIGDDVDVGGVRTAARAKDKAGAAAGGGGGGGACGRLRDDGGEVAPVGGSAGRKVEDIAADVGEVDDSGVEDISYRDALARVAAAGEGGREELLSAEGVRRRKGGGRGDGRGAGSASAAPTTGKYSKADEELMARHQPVQDQLTSDLVELVGRLKGSLTEINAKIVKDGRVIDEAEDAVDKSLTGIGKTRESLAGFVRSTSLSWWTIWALLAAVVATFLAVFVLTKVPI
jgi:hypothetical protein